MFVRVFSGVLNLFNNSSRFKNNIRVCASYDISLSTFGNRLNVCQIGVSCCLESVIISKGFVGVRPTKNFVVKGLITYLHIDNFWINYCDLSLSNYVDVSLSLNLRWFCRHSWLLLAFYFMFLQWTSFDIRRILTKWFAELLFEKFTFVLKLLPVWKNCLFNLILAKHIFWEIILNFSHFKIIYIF